MDANNNTTTLAYDFANRHTQTTRPPVNGTSITTTAGVGGIIHEVLPSFLGTPELYRGGTIFLGGTIYTAYRLSR